MRGNGIGDEFMKISDVPKHGSINNSKMSYESLRAKASGAKEAAR
jgi:hypothetical protein